MASLISGGPSSYLLWLLSSLVPPLINGGPSYLWWLLLPLVASLISVGPLVASLTLGVGLDSQAAECEEAGVRAELGRIAQ